MIDVSEDFKFTNVCSTLTVQSDEKGFFNEFYQCVRDQCGDKWITGEFGKLKSDGDKILALYNDLNVCDIVLGTLEHVRPVFKPKDAKFSYQRRMQGDLLARNGDLKGALLMYSQAVMRAPDTGTNLKLTFYI